MAVPAHAPGGTTLGLPHASPSVRKFARELGVSVETIKDHVAAVLKALGVGSRTQAVLAVGQLVQKQPDAHFSTWRNGQP